MENANSINPLFLMLGSWKLGARDVIAMTFRGIFYRFYFNRAALGYKRAGMLARLLHACGMTLSAIRHSIAGALHS
jgi:hypothetical protein